MLRTQKWLLFCLSMLLLSACIRPEGASMPARLDNAASRAEPQLGHIVFGSRRSGNMDIYIMQTDGSTPVRLTQNDTWDGFPTPSPDGKRIAFVAETMDSQRTPVERDIYVVDTDGSNLTNLTNTPGFDMEPAWSPDGAHLAFTSTRDGDGYTRAVYLMKADGSNVQRLVENADQPAWSPDGTQIAFVQNGQIYRFTLAEEKTIELTDATSPSTQAIPNGGPVWSPDGDRIAFVSNRDGNTEIYVMNADGTGQTNLTDNPSYEGSPVWSPDGHLIAFASERNEAPGIYIMPADGSAVVKLTNATHDEFLPTWSPDGVWIAFVADSTEQIIMRANVPQALQGSGATPQPLTLSQNTFPVWFP